MVLVARGDMETVGSLSKSDETLAKEKLLAFGEGMAFKAGVQAAEKSAEEQK